MFLAVPDADVEDGLQADVSGAGEVLLVLTHLDGLQPLIHRVHADVRCSRVLLAGIRRTAV